MLHSESGVEDELTVVAQTTIHLMSGDVVSAPTHQVNFHESYVTVKVPTGTNYYPWFNITEIERRTVVV